MGKRPLFYSHFILIGFIGLSLLSGATGESLGSQQGDNPITTEEQFLIADSNSELLAQNKFVSESAVVEVLVTAYSSSPDETDDTPFITASGINVEMGIAAANFLPLGTRFKLLDIFGEQIFVVEDRLHSRFNDRIDIWMASKEEAKNFGQKISRLEIL